MPITRRDTASGALVFSKTQEEKDIETIKENQRIILEKLALLEGQSGKTTES